MNTFITNTLEDLKANGLLRSMRTVTGSQSTRITIEGVEYLNFCANNYLGLADDPRLRQAAITGIEESGVGAGASRLVCGNFSEHVQLEKEMAEFKGTESCVLFSTGYMANVGIISSLVGRHDVVFSDRLNHASILDGIKLSGATLKRYAHNDMDSLEDLLKENKCNGKKLIVTDTIFSMDGDIAPLDKIVAVADKYDCMVMVDEAHAFGVIGKNGKGVVEHFGVEDKVDIQMGTFSKAAGSFGAYCCGRKTLIDYFINNARSLVYTTGMPPAICSASLAAVRIIKDQPEIRERLWDNVRHLCLELKGLGFDPGYQMTPIIPLVMKDSALAVEFSRRLLAKGILVSAIRPPTVPINTARLRLTVMATHQIKEIDYLLDNLKTIGQELAVI